MPPQAPPKMTPMVSYPPISHYPHLGALGGGTSLRRNCHPQLMYTYESQVIKSRLHQPHLILRIAALQTDAHRRVLLVHMITGSKIIVK